MSQKSLLSRSPNRSPTPHYTEDFTQSSPSSQSVTRLSTTHSKGQSPKSSSSIAEESLEQADGFKTPPRKGSPPPTEIVSDSPVVNTSTIASHYSLKSIDSENDSSIHTDSDAKRTVDDIGSISEKLDDTKSPSDENSISFENSATDVDSVVDTSDRTLSVHSQRTKEHNDAHHHQSLNHGDRSPEARSATLPGQEDSRPMSLLQDSTLLSPSPPAGMRVNLIKQQLEEEDARAQQQMALLDLREKALVDKTQAELQWLEHQKRLSKSKRDEEGLELLRRKQRNLYAKMTREQVRWVVGNVYCIAMKIYRYVRLSNGDQRERDRAFQIRLLNSLLEMKENILLKMYYIKGLFLWVLGLPLIATYYGEQVYRTSKDIVWYIAATVSLQNQKTKAKLRPTAF